MKKCIKKFRYPLLGSLLVVAITSVYLNLTLIKVMPSDYAYLTLVSKIQANLDRMYKYENGTYLIDNAPFLGGSDINAWVEDRKAEVANVILNPFYKSDISNDLYISGIAYDLYWNVFFKRAAWLDAYCGGYTNRINNCKPNSSCSCLLNNAVRTKLSFDSYHMFAAGDLYQNKAGYIAGCTGAARAFMDLATKFPLGASIRHVTTVNKDQYIYACPQQGVLWSDYVEKMDGHQVVAIQMPNGKWRILNTSSRGIVWARYPGTNTIVETTLSGLVSNSQHRVDIIFPGMPSQENPVVVSVTAAGVDDVFLHAPLMNKYASGNVNDAHCKWPAW